MNEKDIFKAFNNISIDEHEFDNVNVNMSDIQKKKLKNNLKNKIKTNKFKKLKIGAVTAAAVLVCITGIGYMNPSFASQIPGLNPIVQTLNYYGDQGEYAKYSEIINKTVSFNGTSFTINSVVCDENSLVIGYTIKSDRVIDNREFPGFQPSFKINNISMNSGWGGGGKNSDTHTHIGTLEINMARKAYFPSKFKFNMSFNSLLGVKGNWDFKFIVSRDALDRETRSIKPNMTVKLKDTTIKIKKVSLTPINTTILFDRTTDTIYNNWLAFDDRGNELSFKSSDTSRTNFFTNYQSTYNYSKINKTAKKLILVPYTQSDKTGELSKEYNLAKSTNVIIPANIKLPFEASQGKNGKVTITNVTTSDDKLIVQGIVTGNFPQHQVKGVYINSTDKNADSSIRELNTTMKKISANKYEFTREYGSVNNSIPCNITVENFDYINYSKKIEIPLEN